MVCFEMSRRQTKKDGWACSTEQLPSRWEGGEQSGQHDIRLSIIRTYFFSFYRYISLKVVNTLDNFVESANLHEPLCLLNFTNRSPYVMTPVNRGKSNYGSIKIAAT